MQVPVELKQRYLERRALDVQHILSSLEANDFAPAAKLGHQVKGNAATFEFPQIAPIGIEIERAARDRDKDALKLLIKKMDVEIQLAQSLFH